jgi:hypothetical protein
MRYTKVTFLSAVADKLYADNSTLRKSPNSFHRNSSFLHLLGIIYMELDWMKITHSSGVSHSTEIRKLCSLSLSLRSHQGSINLLPIDQSVFFHRKNPMYVDLSSLDPTGFGEYTNKCTARDRNEISVIWLSSWQTINFPTLGHVVVVVHILIWDKRKSECDKDDDISSFVEIYILFLPCMICIRSIWLKCLTPREIHTPMRPKILFSYLMEKTSLIYNFKHNYCNRLPFRFILSSRP